MQDKPPFIASQQILLLDAEAGNPRRFLSPEFFRQMRVREGDENSKDALGKSPWKSTSRDKLFLNGGPYRLCLTTDAGIGKTTTLQWAEQQIGRHHPDRLAIYVQLDDLPTQCDQVAATLAELLLIRSHEPLDREQAVSIIASLLRSGRLVLLVDALDQTLSDTSADTKLRVLARFLQLDARPCPATVAGRPYAIDRYWDTLFDDPSWRFAQLATFTSDQQRSTEMLYRSWPTMQAYASDRGKPGEIAGAALSGYQNEFQEFVVAGQRGEQAAGIAVAFLDAFQPIPPSESSDDALRFRMGSPEHEKDRYADEEQVDARIERSFALNIHAVTNELYELFQPSHRKERGERSPDDRCPVIFVSWYDAWAFCRWLGEEYRLPSEKEWEFACRAGTTTPFHYGDSLSVEQANFDGNYPYGDAPKGEYLERTAVVGSFAPNDWGLYDMHGNVWEWCDTWYSESLAESDRAGYVGSARVLRGGAWFNYGYFCRSACRNNRQPTNSNNNSGFRVAKALDYLVTFG